VRGQAPLSLMGSLYRNKEEVTAMYNRLVKLLPI
jgi:carotenoid cleavage dioxygenase-like enzyme